MSRVKNMVRKLLQMPGVPQARHVAEKAVTPHVTAQVHALTVGYAELERKVDAVWEHQPAVLNAIASTNGTARILVRQFQEGDERVLAQMRPHIDTIGWLLQRVEMIRAEMMHELRYGAGPATHEPAEQAEPRIVNPQKLEAADLRLNLGAGHLAMADYINVDMRELPGIDVVAPIDRLPFAERSVAEIFSSHTLEHFPELELRRRLLPYWFGLIRPGGAFRAVVPDLDAMTRAYASGEFSFERLRSVTYGGQEYEGDFHFTGFTPESLMALLDECGFERSTILARGRPNGDCLEFEIVATRPLG